MKFEEQTSWHDGLRKIVWDNGIEAKPIPRLIRRDSPHFLVIHLFSGRRRFQDVHHWLAQWAEHRGIHLTIVSMDTAVSQAYGNLQDGTRSWEALTKLYEQGVVSATLAGSPCETFSAARHLPPPIEASTHHWPRPLRSAFPSVWTSVFDKEGVETVPARDCFCITDVVCSSTTPSAWWPLPQRAPGMPRRRRESKYLEIGLDGLLTQDTECKLQTFPQWKWGSATPKPTGLFSIRMPYLAKSMYACADPTLPCPAKIAQGLDANGGFNTAACKEYPPLFCRALAKAFSDQFEISLRAKNVIPCSVDDTALHSWLQEAAQESAVVHHFTTFRPDFQGR